MLVVVLGIGAIVASGSSAVFASSADDYTNAVHRALSLVRFAERGDAPSVQQAVITLIEGTGRTQPEVLRDLEKSPPDLNDADQRLTALYALLQSRVDTPNPDQAQQQLHAILSQPRYSGLSEGPSLLDQIMIQFWPRGGANSGSGASRRRRSRP